MEERLPQRARACQSAPSAFAASALAAAALAGPAAAGKSYESTIKISNKFPAFHGKVRSKADVCVSDRKVRLFKVRKGDDKVLGKTRTNMKGKWKIRKTEKPGVYYAKVNKGGSAAIGVTCKAAKSDTVVID